jgi:serine protease Do
VAVSLPVRDGAGQCASALAVGLVQALFRDSVYNSIWDAEDRSASPRQEPQMDQPTFAATEPDSSLLQPDEPAALDASVPPAPAWEHDRPNPPERASRSGGARLVLAAAVLSAVLSSGMTFAALQLGMAGTGAPAATAVTGVTAAAMTPAVVQGSLAATAGTAAANEAVATRVAAGATASVVTIETAVAGVADPFGAGGITGSGSGFVVSANGLILTNNHVINGATSIQVTFEDGRQLTGTVVAVDAPHDLALVKVAATGLKPLALGDSSALVVGQVAIAIGSPLGTFSDTITQGIVSGLGRTIDVGQAGSRRSTHLSGLIQTDAAINPGNSGGPLLDAAGNVIGIVTATASNSQGVGFAVPIAVALPLISGAPGS